jgi:glc operon protein GlcG
MSGVEKRYSITGAAVQKILNTMYDQACKDGKSVFIAVVDGTGEIMGLIAHEKTPAICRQISQDKAYTAFVSRMKTSAWKSYVFSTPEEERHLMLTRPRFIAASGGAPIVVDGLVAGGIGVSGASQDYDEYLADLGAALVAGM